MIEIGAFEAKTHFSELLRRVKAGESFCITRRGIPVAQIVPIKKNKNHKKSVTHKWGPSKSKSGAF